MMQTTRKRPHVGLFVTCLVDLFRPCVGFAAVKLLEDHGCDVSVPDSQTCCGQPAYNMGDQDTAVSLARQLVYSFDVFDFVVAPSGSCAGMIKKHLPELLSKDQRFSERALKLADKTYELTSFLGDILGIEKIEASFSGQATYHDSCAGLRELGIKEQPRKLLSGVAGLDLVEMAEPEVCCGFGGVFCVKYPELSGAIAEKKCADIAATGAPLVLAGDLGCLMNIAGKLSREKKAVDVRHVAEVLADMTAEPAIGRRNVKDTGK